MKSLSEIDTTSKRASRAAGYSWGVAEEIGKNIRLLELFGLEGIKTLNQYYGVKNKEKFERMSKLHNPYGDGLASKRIVNFIKQK